MIMKCKGTNIEISVSNAEEAFIVYKSLGHRYEFILDNGETLKKMGPTGDGSYFAGYTAPFFKKYF